MEHVMFVRWTREIQPETWGAAAALLGVMLLFWYVHRINDPRQMERAVARKKERMDVADIVSAALQDAAHQGKITADAWHKYNKMLAVKLGLPDMLPKKPFILKVAKDAAYRRLAAMGVDVVEGLRNLKQRRVNGKDKKAAIAQKLVRKTK